MTAIRDPIPNRLGYPDNIHVDLITGQPIYKDLDRNKAHRLKLIRLGMDDTKARHTIIGWCRRSFEFWCNYFAWTYHVNESDDEGREVAVSETGAHAPFITWPVQDEAGAVFDECIARGDDQLWDKSRKMGASWYLVAKLHHRWLFYRNVEIREISRKEEYVDAGTPKDLFWKHDYLNRFLPPWMLPSLLRKKMLIKNLLTGSSIVGESTNKDAIRGDRAWAILIDEAAAIDKLEPVLRSTDRAGPRIFNSTPAGPGTFADLRKSGKVRIIDLPWWRHPGVGKGASLKADRQGVLRWTSPAYEHACATRTPREIAQNWDRDHSAAGAMFFDPGVLSIHSATYGQEPWVKGALSWEPSRRDTFEYQMRKGVAKFQFTPRGGGVMMIDHLSLWFDPAVMPEDMRTVIGCDISHGSGASQSCACVYNANTGAKMAELVDPYLDPAVFADIVAMLGWWLGAGRGRGAGLIVPEANGPGGIFLNRLSAIAYPHIYRHVPSGKSADTPTKTLGWHSSPQEKVNKLGQYAQAMMSGRIQNRSRYAVSQCEQYVYMNNGQVGPGTMESADGSAKAVHGDIVIADMLAVEGMQRVGRYEPIEHKPPPRSVAWWIDQSRRAKAAENLNDQRY